MSNNTAPPIPMVDLTAQYPLIRAEIEQGLHAALDEAKFILGPNVQAFEKAAAAYLGVAHAIGCASGTDALHLALRAAGIGPGDEVITTPFSFIATAEAICYVGATPKFVDIDPATFNIDPNCVAEAITAQTKAIMPVHLFGQPANLPALSRLADEHGLILIEDCAQSFGASINEQMTGSLGALGAFSFFPSKNLGGYGDGGLVTTNDDALATELRVLRNHGSRERYHHQCIGLNSRLDELQAVILQAKLPHIDAFNAGRRRVAHHYTAALSGLPGFTPPVEDGIGTHVYHQYTVLSEGPEHREEVMRRLETAQIASAVYYPIPLHQQEAFAHTHPPALPVAESVAQRCFSLPMYPELSLENADRVIAAIKHSAHV
ncbi:erythromycin biosynthesis sensory transduction protein eryC1 [Spiribacter sp. C176]|uniref:Erythromycin biosynthesis sensory transduction protein eryC1 n=1 Tax=Spiribacter salilacus TaxID=2664894 RepID=A0A6N7QQ08_9GAMM|nr:DegT/DnrJ/EryC1/StrS family aminotransferase [Spiribacter salilacus]MRH77218.1 erythromycin biosynthesis sensory transduction protein eryC1 [Spiribacter salilacus]